ncbi:MAG: glycosyltransferase family 9 protein [Blastocatellia bacterium]
MEQMGSSTIQVDRILLSHVTGIVEAVLLLPVLEALRESYPGTTIGVVTTSSAGPVYARSRVPPQIWTVGNWREGELLDPRQLWGTVRAIKELRHDPVDLLVELIEDGPTRWLRACLPAPAWRLTPAGLHRGRTRSWERWIRRLWEPIGLASQRREYPPALHRTQEWLHQLEPLGVRPSVSAPRLSTDASADQRIARRLEKQKRAGRSESQGLLIGLGAGDGLGGMDWRKEQVVSLARRLVHHYDARILLLNDPSRPSWIREVESELRRAIPGRSLRLPARLSFDETLSLLARLSVLVAPLGSLAHLAAAVYTPVVALTRDPRPGPLDLLSPHTVHVRPSRLGVQLEDEQIYEGACQLMHISRAELLTQR